MTVDSPTVGSPVLRPAAAPVRAAAAGLVLWAADVLVDPVHTHVPLCVFHAATGWQCPLCGGLRAMDDLGRGHLAAAAHDNVLLLVALPVVALAWLLWLRRDRAGVVRRPLPRSAVVALVVLGVAFTVVRNLPGFAALRPA